MCVNRVEFFRREKMRVFFVGKDGENRFFMDEFRLETVALAQVLVTAAKPVQAESWAVLLVFALATGWLSFVLRAAIVVNPTWVRHAEKDWCHA